jgi:nuclease S1
MAPETARQVAALLGPERLAYVGTWADDIRSDPAWAKADSWHWVTIQPGQTYAESKKNPAGDVIEAIARFERILADTAAPRTERQQALKWLVHLVADVHQPLHVGRGDDRGGNEIVVLWFGEPSNLHSVWDSGLILRTELSSPELAEKADVATAEEAKAWQSSTALEWASESSALLDKVYTLGDRRLSFRYVFEQWPTVEKRIGQAGVRLAGLLDRLLGPERGKAGAWLPR